MRPRDVLAANLRELMKANPELSRFPDITTASHGKLVNGTLDRIRRAEVALTLDKLADLADVFGVEPWQLLVENLNPKALPRLVDAEFLSQIKQIVGVAQGANQQISPSPTDELPLQKEERSRQVDVGPALREAFTRGNNGAGSSSAKEQKPKGRRSR